MNRHAKFTVSAIGLILILSSACGIFSNCAGSAVDTRNHPQPGIWEYKNSVNRPAEPLVLTLEQELWQAGAAASITPAFIGRSHNTPLLFDDGSESRAVQIPHETKGVTEFGTDLPSASAAIANTYWSRAEIAVVAGTYEHVLWAVPIASFLSAPILVSPDAATLQGLGVKCAIVIGMEGIESAETILLNSREEVWQFQLELFDTKGQKCNYIVVTNPYDTAEDDNIKWKYLSLSSAPLAAFRGALVLSANYTGDRAALDSIASANKNLDDTYLQVKPFFEKIKNDTFYAAQFLTEHGHEPEFLALVGGSYALPNYFFDYHVQYFYWGASLDYVASIAPYGNMTYNLTYDTYPREDLATGRIMGHSLLDCSILLMRTFSYGEFLGGGQYDDISPASWENRSAVIEGHRVNQPNSGGPLVPNTVPYYPAGDVDEIFTEAGFNETYFLPRNITVRNDPNMPVGEVLNNASSSSMLLVNAHGGVAGEQALIEIGIDPILEKEYTFILDEQEVLNREYPPSVVYVIACETGSTAIDISMEDYISLGFLHSGAVTYIAPDTFQTICFWDKAPSGPEADQTISFFSKLLNENIAVGTAFSQAKWETYQSWRNESTYEEDVAGTTVLLYGDPAFEPYKPEVSYTDNDRFDVSVEYDDAQSTDLDVSVRVTDLYSNTEINDAQVRITFNGKSDNRYTAQFKVPDEQGTYVLEVAIGKEGYEGLKVKYRIHETGDNGDNTPLMLLAGSAVIVIAVVLIYRKKRAGPKTFNIDEGAKKENSSDKDNNGDIGG
jgi:hypothetical protein